MRSILLAALILVVPSLGAAEFLPVLAIAPVKMTDAAAAAGLVARLNGAMRERHRVPLFVRLYQELTLTGEPSKAAFMLRPSGSLAGLEAGQRALADDPELTVLWAGWQALVGDSPVTHVQAVRFDGTNTPGWLLNSWVRAERETSLLARIAGWTEELARAGAPVPKVNVFRVMTVAADDPTHLVSVNTASDRELAAVRDRLASLPLVSSEPGAVTLVRQTAYRELVP